LRTKDGGKTWDKPPLGAAQQCEPVGPTRPTRILVDPNDRRHLWFGVEVDGPFRSLDGGDTWTKIPMMDWAAGGGESSQVTGGADPGGPLPIDAVDGDVHDMTFALEGRRSIWVHTAYQAFVSHDRGTTWYSWVRPRAHFALPWQRSVVTRWDDPNVVFMGMGPDREDRQAGPPRSTVGAIQRTLDGGKTWQQADLPVAPTGTVGSLAAHPADPKLVVASTFSSQIYRTHDGGDTWENVPSPVSSGRSTIAWLPN
jgi:photosystem II stability/assembly factor-like uncharacterized protein